MEGVKKSVNTQVNKKTLPDGSVEVKTVTVTRLTYSDGTYSEQTETSTKTESLKQAETTESLSLNLKFRTEAKGEPKLQSSIPAVAVQNKAATKPKRNASNIDWRTFGLNKHNEYRKQHHSPPLVLDPKLSDYAQEWAEHLVSRGQSRGNPHRPDHKYGENISHSWSSRGPSEDDAEMESAIVRWYDEVKKYRFGGESFISGTGHFTQVVWKESTRLGLGMAHSSDGHTWVVANYDPPGNFQGKYKQNVMPI